MAVTLSALRTGRALFSRKIRGIYFRYRLSKPPGHIAAGKIREMGKNLIISPELEPATFRLVM
jgi:hypothetical protein